MGGLLSSRHGLAIALWTQHLRLPEQAGAQKLPIVDGGGAFQAQPLPEKLWFGGRKHFFSSVAAGKLSMPH